MNARTQTALIASRIATRTGTVMTMDDVNTLRRIQLTLHGWAEQECNGTIQRDDNGCVRGYSSNPDARYIDEYYKVADRETGALKRLAKIMTQYPSLTYYHQTDPRGCALYVGTHEQMANEQYTNGVAVCS